MEKRGGGRKSYGKVKDLFIFIFFLFFSFVLLGSFVISDWHKGVPVLVVNSVGPNQILSGYINMSFENETGSSEVRVEVDGKKRAFKLMDWLNLANIGFVCWREDKEVPCEVYWEKQEGSSEFQGSEGDNRIGLVVYGENVSISKLSFELIGESSSTKNKCGVIPLTIDLFEDGEIDYEWVKPALTEKCYRVVNPAYEPASAGTSLITTTPYCAEIHLDYKTGKMEIGGIIKLYNTSYSMSAGDVILTIESADGLIKKTCNATNIGLSDFSNASCEVEAIFSEGNYTICVKSSAKADQAFAIKKSGTDNFALFMAPFKIQPLVGNIKFNETFYKQQTGKDLISALNDWIDDRWNKNCTMGCIIPFYIKASASFSLKNLNLVYVADGVTNIESNFYKLSKSYPLVDTKGYKSIPLTVFNLTSPVVYGSYELVLYYKGDEIKSESFLVEKVPLVVNLVPSEVITGEPTQFKVIAYSPKDNPLTEYSVDWGDGHKDTGSSDVFTHTYSADGNYTVVVKVKDNESLEGIGYFVIEVGLPYEALSNKVTEALNGLNQFELSLTGTFYRSWLKEKLQVNLLKSKLTNLSNKLNAMSPLSPNTTLLKQVKQEFDSINYLPIALADFGVYDSLEYGISWESIDKGLAESIGGICPYESEECKKAIALWNQEYIKVSVSGEKKKIRFANSNSESVLTLININLNSNTSGYVIVKLDPSKLTANMEYEDLGSGIGFNFSGNSFIRIAVLDDIDPYSVTLYAVPSSLDSLPEVGISEVGEAELYQPPKKSKLPLIISLVILVGVIAGLVVIWRAHLVAWTRTKIHEMKVKKEKKLFPSKADYYNLMNFIANSIKAKIPEEKIKEKLLNAGWKIEQINYGLKKIKEFMKVKK